MSIPEDSMLRRHYETEMKYKAQRAIIKESQERNFKLFTDKVNPVEVETNDFPVIPTALFVLLLIVLFL